MNCKAYFCEECDKNSEVLLRNGTRLCKECKSTLKEKTLGLKAKPHMDRFLANDPIDW